MGWSRGRWARTVHALSLGREYIDPFDGLHRADHVHSDEIFLLCCFDCCAGIVLGLGIGQCMSICGNCGVNFQRLLLLPRA